jgi:hypothetical protein
MVSNFNLVFTNSDILQSIYKFQKPMVKQIKKTNRNIKYASEFIHIIDKILMYDKEQVRDLWKDNFDDDIPDYMIFEKKYWKKKVYQYMVDYIVNKLNRDKFDDKLFDFFEDNRSLNKCLSCLDICSNLRHPCDGSSMEGDNAHFTKRFGRFTIGYVLCLDCHQMWFDKVAQRITRNKKTVDYYPMIS